MTGANTAEPQGVEPVLREVDVIIVGGGPSGLACSALLSTYGLTTYLVSKYPETSRLPKAHLLFSKTMEIFREIGIEAEIRGKATPEEHVRYVGWYAGLAGPDPDAGREIARLEAWSGGGRDHQWAGASAAPTANLMQAELEPIMQARAAALAPGSLHYNHLFHTLEQDAEGVTASIEDRATGATYRVRGRYLLACDGGRAVGPLLGVALKGRAAVATNISVHFTADLSPWARDPQVLLRGLLNPEIGTPCVLVPMGPDHWGPDSEEWVFHIIALPGDHNLMRDEDALAHMRRALGVPELPLQVNQITRWPQDGLVANSFRAGRVFILGDAAHRMPPAGGHGMNTAVQDCYNLCWKLAAVHQGQAADSLLDSYETERRPIAIHIVGRAMDNWSNLSQLPRAIGFSPQHGVAENWANMRALWEESPRGDMARSRVQDALAALLPTYNHLNENFGYTYAEGCLIADGSPPPTPIDPVHAYTPTSRPGASAPHAWLENQHGRVALGQLIAGRFALIAGEEGGAWCEAARAAAARWGIDLTAFTIGQRAADWRDFRFEWAKAKEIGPSGAVLVRPDRFVAWRAQELSADPQATLTAMFAELLGRQVGPALSPPSSVAA